jgi:cytochrome c-type biogenesis protein CcmE
MYHILTFGDYIYAMYTIIGKVLLFAAVKTGLTIYVYLRKVLFFYVCEYPYQERLHARTSYTPHTESVVLLAEKVLNKHNNVYP